MSSLKVYKLAVCLAPGCTTLDFQGPIELLSSFSTDARKKYEASPLFQFPTQCAIDPVYLSHTLDPVSPMFGPALVPNQTYSGTTEQIDIILIPGGLGMQPHLVDPSMMEFFKRQAPGAKHILSVCNGAWVLAATGLLDGKKATTNKALFKTIVEATKDHPITWIPKARWVVNDDKKIWTSSGVTAGMDMAKAFLAYLITDEFANYSAAMLEWKACEEGDDDFAAIHGLV